MGIHVFQNPQLGCNPIGHHVIDVLSNSIVLIHGLFHHFAKPHQETAWKAVRAMGGTNSWCHGVRNRRAVRRFDGPASGGIDIRRCKSLDAFHKT